MGHNRRCVHAQQHWTNDGPAIPVFAPQNLQAPQLAFVRAPFVVSYGAEVSLLFPNNITYVDQQGALRLALGVGAPDTILKKHLLLR